MKEQDLIKRSELYAADEAALYVTKHPKPETCPAELFNNLIGLFRNQAQKDFIAGVKSVMDVGEVQVTQEILRLIEIRMKEAKAQGWFVEATAYALKYMKENPKLSINEAYELGWGEMIK